MLNDIVHSLI